MALSKQTQQDVRDLNDQIDILENKINNIGNRLGTQMKDKLTELKNRTKDWTDEFSKGGDISNKLKNQLSTTQKDFK